jgi:hypothetical protein
LKKKRNIFAALNTKGRIEASFMVQKKERKAIELSLGKTLFFCSKQNCREHCSVAVLLNGAHRTILTLKLAAITFHIELVKL